MSLRSGGLADMVNGWAVRLVAAACGVLVVFWYAPQAVAAAGPPRTDRFTIDMVKFTGSGCRPGSAVVAVSPDNLAFTVTYSGYSAATGPGTKMNDDQKHCKLSLRIQAPPGFTYAIGRTIYRGFAQLAAGVTAIQTARYYFNGPGKTAAVEHDLTGPYGDDWQTTDEGPSAYEQCGKQRQFHIDTDLTLQGASPDPNVVSVIAMDSTDGTIQTTVQLLTKSCATVRAVAADHTVVRR